MVGMQNTDIGLAVLVICPVCPVTLTDGSEPKMRPKTGGARPGPAEL